MFPILFLLRWNEWPVGHCRLWPARHQSYETLTLTDFGSRSLDGSTGILGDPRSYWTERRLPRG